MDCIRPYPAEFDVRSGERAGDAPTHGSAPTTDLHVLPVSGRQNCFEGADLTHKIMWMIAT